MLSASSFPFFCCVEIILSYLLSKWADFKFSHSDDSSEMTFEKGAFRGTPAERRDKYRSIIERLEITVSKDDELLAEF